MSEPKVIGRVLCGSCDPKHRHVMAKLVDTPVGAALRANLRYPSQGSEFAADRPTARFHYDDLLLTDMGDPWTQTKAITLGCPKHTVGAFLPEYFAAIEAEYRRTGRPVNRIVHFSPPVPLL